MILTRNPSWIPMIKHVSMLRYKYVYFVCCFVYFQSRIFISSLGFLLGLGSEPLQLLHCPYLQSIPCLFPCSSAPKLHFLPVNYCVSQICLLLSNFLKNLTLVRIQDQYYLLSVINIIDLNVGAHNRTSHYKQEQQSLAH